MSQSKTLKECFLCLEHCLDPLGLSLPWKNRKREQIRAWHELQMLSFSLFGALRDNSGGTSWWSSGWNSELLMQDLTPGLHPWVGKILWRRKWQSIPVFLPENSHGQRSWQPTVHGVAKSWTWLSDWACTQGIKVPHALQRSQEKTETKTTAMEIWKGGEARKTISYIRWVFWWHKRCAFCGKLLSHSLQSKGFSAVCVLWCVRKWERWLKVLPHSGQR